MHLTRILRVSAAALIATGMVVAPALAAGNGNGNGNGNGGGNGAGAGGGNAGGNSASHSSSDSAGQKSGTAAAPETGGMKHSEKTMGATTSKEKSAMKAAPSNLGKLNGFLNASPEALKKAAPNSAIGLVTHGYADALNGYLAGGQGGKSLSDVHAALQRAANKPLTTATVEAVDAKLATMDPALSKAIEAYPGGSKALAKEIAAAGPAKKATGTTAPAMKKTVQ